MKKSLFATCLLAGLPFFSQAAGFAPPAECYPLVHGENGQGSTNFIRLPHLRTDTTWNNFISVTNESDKQVNVKLKFNDMEGLIYNPYSVLHYGDFTSTNSPLNLSGAVLKPNHTAQIVVRDPDHIGMLSGKLSWQADACIDSALHVSVRTHSSGGYTSLLQLNGGQLF